MRHLLRFLLPAVVLVVGLPLCLGALSQTLGDRAAAESLSLVEENVRRAAVECYALEGAYPQDFDYLAERYGVAVDESRCRVDYIYIGSNLMPDITVVPLEGSA